MIFELVQDNFVAVSMTLFLILFIRTNNNFEKRTNQLFLAAASCVLILIIEEAWEAQLALGTVYSPLRVVLSSVGYGLRPMIPYFLVMIAKQYEKRKLLLFSIPIIFNTLVAFSALFCKVSFWYTPENEFARGPLGFTPFVVAGIYVVIMLVQTIVDCRRGGLMEAMIVSAIVLLAFLSTVLESMFHLRFIQNPSIATSITFYYLFLHSNRNNRDPLTTALTRRRFYFDAQKYRSVLTAVISLDLNNLKILNDRHGHKEGDKSLIAVTNIIKRYAGPRVSLYRTGGDEFMILCYKMNEEKVRELISAIEADLEKTPYRCAIGYAICSSHTDFESACQLADNSMYENKRIMKKKEAEKKQ